MNAVMVILITLMTGQAATLEIFYPNMALCQAARPAVVREQMAKPHIATVDTICLELQTVDAQTPLTGMALARSLPAGVTFSRRSTRLDLRLMAIHLEGVAGGQNPLPPFLS